MNTNVELVLLIKIGIGADNIGFNNFGIPCSEMMEDNELYKDSIQILRSLLVEVNYHREQ